MSLIISLTSGDPEEMVDNSDPGSMIVQAASAVRIVVNFIPNEMALSVLIIIVPVKTLDNLTNIVTILTSKSCRVGSASAPSSAGAAPWVDELGHQNATLLSSG